MLDLFCGTKSIANAFEKEGFEVLTLDSNLQFNPLIWADVVHWEYKMGEKESSVGQRDIDVIWASPPCEAFSVASVYRHWVQCSKECPPDPITGTAERAIQLVQKTIEIIEYFKPRYWFIENPRAMLRKMPFMRGLPRHTITYCQYGDTRMKPTDIWGIFPKSFPMRKCKAGDKCHEPAPRGSKTGTQGLKNSIERGRIPEELCFLLAWNIKNEINKEHK